MDLTSEPKTMEEWLLLFLALDEYLESWAL